MAGYYSVQFGVEIELLIGSRSKTHKTWKSLASEVSARLLKAGIPNHINEGNDKSAENYQEWSLTQEVTIPAQAGKNLWGMELVSPVFLPSHPWNVHLEAIFKVLKASFTVTPSSHTSTHIHVSMSPSFSPGQLVSLAKSILYFEPALDALLPPSRASAYWCQSPRANPALHSLSLPDCFLSLDYCADVPDVVRAMNLFPARSAYGRANGYTEDFVHGHVYKWDFSGLLDGGLGTVEFRQAPGSRSADEVHTWVQLAVSFVTGAVEEGAALNPAAQVSMEDLWWLISAGAQSTGIGDLKGIEKLYAGGGGKGKSGGK